MRDSIIARILPVIIGIVLTGILLIGLGYIAKKRQSRELETIPQLTIVQPGPGEALDSPLVVRFASTRPIELKSTGWGTGTLHLHAHVNHVEHMPAAADITRADTLYLWQLPAVPRGPLILHLGWADQRHRALGTGASDSVRATLR
ncbi:MAG TPA: hypothetical protein VGD27_08265 [Longimicrobiales bacterium]